MINKISKALPLKLCVLNTAIMIRLVEECLEEPDLHFKQARLLQQDNSRFPLLLQLSQHLPQLLLSFGQILFPPHLPLKQLHLPSLQLLVQPAPCPLQDNHLLPQHRLLFLSQFEVPKRQQGQQKIDSAGFQISL